MLLNKVNILGWTGSFSILISNGKISSISAEQIQDNSQSINFSEATVFPGLINSHDHIDFNLFPRLRNRIYNNYREWGKDIHENNKNEINSILNIPQPLRVKWGLYKNLLCGVTTVVNHGDKLNIGEDIISVFQEANSLHSVGFEKLWKLKLNNPLTRHALIAIHAGEGTDEVSHNEIDQLISSNYLNKDIVAIHGVPMDKKQASKFKALVWCPLSNHFLLNKTADIKDLKTATNVIFGTDSTLTANWNIWSHLQEALAEEQLTDKELFESITSIPARVWDMQDIGLVEANKTADLVVAKGSLSFPSFFNTTPGDILLVIHKGEIKLYDESLAPQIKPTEKFTKLSIDGITKYVYGDLKGLVTDIRKYKPDCPLPITITE